MYKVEIIGNLTADPVLYDREKLDEETGEIISAKVCNFSVGANAGYGAYKTTQYFKVSAWRKLGENCAKYLKKGRQVYIEGIPSINSYVKNNVSRYSLDVRVEKIEFLQDGKRITATEEQITEEPSDFCETPY